MAVWVSNFELLRSQLAILLKIINGVQKYWLDLYNNPPENINLVTRSLSDFSRVDFNVDEVEIRKVQLSDSLSKDSVRYTFNPLYIKLIRPLSVLYVLQCPQHSSSVPLNLRIYQYCLSSCTLTYNRWLYQAPWLANYTERKGVGESPHIGRVPQY